jgi:DNA repair protein RadC
MTSQKRLTMKTIPAADRPTEKLYRLGSRALSDAELLAVIIRSGTVHETALSVCQRLLAETDNPSQTQGLRSLLDRSPEQLKEVPGIGTVRAAQIKAALELGNRLQTQSQTAAGRPAIRDPEDAIRLLESDMRYLPSEEFRAVLLDSRNRLIRVSQISAGTLNAAIVHPRDLFREAVKANAAALILAHNHPSGDQTPSQEDVQAPENLRRWGNDGVKDY